MKKKPTAADRVFRSAAAGYGAIYDSMERSFIRLIRTPGRLTARDFEIFLAEWRLVFGGTLMATSIASWLTGGAELARRLNLGPLLAKPPEPLLFLPPEAQFISFPVMDTGALTLFRKNLVTRKAFDALTASARAQSFTVAKVTAKKTLEKLRNSLAEATAQGLTQWEWEHALTGSLRTSFMGPAHAETVFRSNVQRALSEGLSAVLGHPLVTDLFPYEAVSYINDDRLCELCAKIVKGGIDGTRVYRRDDPTYRRILPPSHFSCRCGRLPATIEMAAAEGVQEAILWLKTGTPPAKPAWVPMPVEMPKGWAPVAA